MDNGGSNPDENKLPHDDSFELEVNEKDVDFVGADIESPDENGDLPTDDSKVIEGDLPTPEDSDIEAKEEDTPEKKPEESEGEKDDEGEDSGKPEDDVIEDSEDKPEKEPKDEGAEEPGDKPEESNESEDSEKPEESEKPDEEPKDEGVEESEDKPESEPEEVAPVVDKEEKDEPVEEEPIDGEVKEEAGEETTEASENEPIEEPIEDKKPEDAPLNVVGVNAPVDSTQANDTFPVQPAEEKKKNNKTGLFVLIAIIIFLLIGCGIFFAISSNKGNNNNNNNQGGNNQKEEVGDKLARELDVKLLKDWANSEENALYSPLSIKNVLAMLAEATDGETKQEVADLIGENYEPRKYANNKNMTIANALFVRDDFKELIKNSYIDLIKEKYNANTIYDPFNNAATVNDWAYKNTLSLIPKVLEDKDVQRMDYFWINAVAIDMNWVNNFQCAFNNGKESGKCIEYSVGYPHTTYGAHVPPYESENPSPVDFNGKGKVNSLLLGATINNYDIVNELGEDYIRNTVKEAYDKWKASANESDIETMEKEGFSDFDSYFKPYLEELKKPYGDLKYSTDFRISNDEDFKVFAKDLQEYGGTQLEYVAVMPKKTTLKEFVNDASVEKIDEITSNLKEIKNENFSDKKVTKIIGNIPIFNYDINYDFVKELKKLGVKGIFEDKANFSPMTDSDLVKVTDGVHVATIDFSNEGIKAAAVTTLGGIGDGGLPFDYYWDLPTEEIDMTFNKPYMYIIRDKANGEVWFMGTVYEPTVAK